MTFDQLFADRESVPNSFIISFARANWATLTAMQQAAVRGMEREAAGEPGDDA